MKKIVSILATILCVAAVNAQRLEFKQVSGPNKEINSVFSMTYSHDYKKVDAAIKERLQSEGLKGKKAKNGFIAYQGVKYNYLWDKTFDFYTSVTGSKNAGTLNLLLSTGYGNYISTDDAEVRSRVYEWMLSLETDILKYLQNEKIVEAEKDLEKAKKENEKLDKQLKQLEKKIASNDNAIKTFEASRTIANQNDINSIDPKVLAKEQKTARKLEDERIKLNNNKYNLEGKISEAEKLVNQRKEKVNQLKSVKF